MTITWEELGALSLARQFPVDAGHLVAAEEVDPVALLDAIGPIQTQTARSAFLALAARTAGDSARLTHAQISAAYDTAALVRGSTIRGTVHTATPEQFALLGVAARLGLRRMWTAQLAMADERVEELWAATEAYADHPRTPADLQEFMAGWLAEHESAESARRAREHPGRFLAFAHGNLIRSPASGVGWERQTKPVYRALAPADVPPLPALVEAHLRWHGPASRHDLAWWSGLRLTSIDEAIAAVQESTVLMEYAGPDGRTYLDPPSAPEPIDLPGVRLLPEFDAILCGYDSKTRDRFATPEQHSALWNQKNGLILAPLLTDGRVGGYWRAMGSAKKRPLEVVWFAGTRRPRKAELERPVAALEAALDITVTDLKLTREAV